MQKRKAALAFHFMEREQKAQRVGVIGPEIFD
jgi:hypothetical protein